MLYIIPFVQNLGQNLLGSTKGRNTNLELGFTNQHNSPVKIWQSVFIRNNAQRGKAFRLSLSLSPLCIFCKLWHVTAGRRTSEYELQIPNFQIMSCE